MSEEPEKMTRQSAQGLKGGLFGNPNLRACTFLNRADPRKTQNAGAIEVLESAGLLTFLNTPLRSRKAFRTAAAQGLAVTELRPADPKAAREIKALHAALFGR